MEINNSLVEYIAATYYDINPSSDSIKKLYGYSDKNYLFQDLNSGEKFVLKLVSPDESQSDLTTLIDETLLEVERYLEEKSNEFIIQVPKLIKTTAARPSGFVSIRIKTDSGQAQLIECNFKLFTYFTGLTVFEFLAEHKEVENRARFYTRIGRASNELSRSLSGLCYLSSKLKEIRQKYHFVWDLMSCVGNLRLNLNIISEPSRRELVERSLDKFESIRAELDGLPQFVVHGDLGTRNIMLASSSVEHYHRGIRQVDELKRDICIIDFQDIQTVPKIVDCSNTLLYLILEQESLPFEQALVQIPIWFLRGYQSTGVQQIQFEQLNLVPILMRLRLCQSLINGLLAYKREPSNLDVLQTNQRGWYLLDLLCNNQLTHDEQTDNKSGQKYSCKLVKLWTTSSE